MAASLIVLGELGLDRGQPLAQFGNIIEALYIDSHCINARFKLVVHRTKLLPHLLLKGINALVGTIKTPVHPVQALVDSIQALINSIQLGFNVRQALAYLRKLRREPGLQCRAEDADRNLLRLLDAFYRHDFHSIRTIHCSR